MLLTSDVFSSWDQVLQLHFLFIRCPSLTLLAIPELHSL